MGVRLTEDSTIFSNSGKHLDPSQLKLSNSADYLQRQEHLGLV